MVESTQKFDCEAARAVCGRLHYMSDEQLTDLCTSSANFASSCAHLMNIEKAQFCVEGNLVKGIQAPNDEKLVFEHPVSVGEYAPKTINEVLEASRRAVYEQIKSAVKFGGSMMDLLKSNHISQAIEMAMLIKMHKEFMTHIGDAVGADAVEKVQAACAKTNEMLDALSKEMHKEMSVKHKSAVSNAIMHYTAHRNWASDCCDMLKKGFPRVAAGPLRDHVFFSWNNGVQIDCQAYKPAYGYEYHGTVDRLVITPLTRKAYMEFGRGCYQGRPVIINGPAGSGKTETAVDWFRLCGKNCQRVNCSDELTNNACEALAKGTAGGDTWLCMDEFNRIHQEIQKFLMLACQKYAMLPDHFVVLSANPGYAGRAAAPPDTYRNWTQLNMYVPDLVDIVQVMMYSEGLGHKPTDCGQKLMDLMYEMKASFKNQWLDLGLRAIKEITCQSGLRCRSGMDAMVSTHSALADHFRPMFVGEDLTKFEGILAKHFPDTQVADFDTDGFAAKFAAANPGANDEQKAKALAIYKKSKIRHSLMVIEKSADTTLVDMVVKAIGATSATYRWKTAEMTETKYFVGSPEQNKDFYDKWWVSQLTQPDTDVPHWITVSGEDKVGWCEVAESLNSVMDDNKQLHLPGGSYKFKRNMRFVMVTANCNMMTPAMVSRMSTVIDKL